LKVAALFIDAKDALGKEGYNRFLATIRYEPKSSSVRKWECIGSQRFKLDAVAEHLPPNWTTIYKISRLSPTMIDELIVSNVLSPATTAAEIDAELNPRLIKNSRLAITIIFGDLADPTDIATILDKCASVPCTIKKTDSLERLLSCHVIEAAPSASVTH